MIKEAVQFLESSTELSKSWQPKDFNDIIKIFENIKIHEKHCVKRLRNFLKTTKEFSKAWKPGQRLIKPQKFPIKKVPTLNIKLKMNKPKLCDKIKTVLMRGKNGP